MKLTEAQRQSYRDHPEYSEGFYDAQCGDPLFDDATDPYRAGWEAFYVCKEIMDHNGFSRTADGSFEKSFTIGRALHTKDAYTALFLIGLWIFERVSIPEKLTQP